jgi:hypothetical protein
LGTDIILFGRAMHSMAAASVTGSSAKWSAPLAKTTTLGYLDDTGNVTFVEVRVEADGTAVERIDNHTPREPALAKHAPPERREVVAVLGQAYVPVPKGIIGGLPEPGSP